MIIAIGTSNELISEGLKAIFQDMEGASAVSVFRSAGEMCKSTIEADVYMVDFSSVGFSLEGLSKIIKSKVNSRVIAITPLQPANTVLNAIKAGIHGYVKTDCSISEIKQSVKETLEGETFICGDILRALGTTGVDVASLADGELDCGPILLSDRETEILRFVATGHTNAEIAEILFLSSYTVGTHRKNIMAKIGAKNTAEAVLYAVKEGVVDTDSLRIANN